MNNIAGITKVTYSTPTGPRVGTYMGTYGMGVRVRVEGTMVDVPYGYVMHY